MSHLNFRDFYSKKLLLFEEHLTKTFPSLPEPVGILEEAMRYSLFAGGKRIRPVLTMVTTECCGKDPTVALPYATALEYIHTYSLIHDDLPCMDDDDLRRGVPTNHVKFGEAIALLAGDALLTHAFALISSDELRRNTSAEINLKIVHLLAKKAGVFGMVTGQVADIRKPYYTEPGQSLDFTHRHKTGALITSSVQIGALLGEVNDDVFNHLTKYGEEIGKCFQIQDDILDETGDKERMGKTPGSDKKNLTLTYPNAFGLEKSRELATQSYSDALACLEKIPFNTLRLKELADFILKRDR